MIEAVGVAVPAHNEETLLPSCLTALRRAARQVSVPVHLLVAADSCTDRTAAVARACGALVIGIHARSVGAARAAGMAELLRLTAGRDPAAIWLATTDADTIVPPSWLQRQVAHADRDWDVVLGTISVRDWSEHPPHLPAAFAARYDHGDRPHPHVHGANIGIRASAYRAAGGFRPLPTAEDHALLTAAAQAGCSVLSAGDITVETSARRHARAPHGFSHLLRTLAPAPQPQLSGRTCKSTRPADNHDYALVGNEHRRLLSRPDLNRFQRLDAPVSVHSVDADYLGRRPGVFHARLLPSGSHPNPPAALGRAFLPVRPAEDRRQHFGERP